MTTGSFFKRMLRTVAAPVDSARMAERRAREVIELCRALLSERGELVPLALDEHETAFNRGEVDAIVTFEPRRSHLLEAGAHVLFSSAEIPEEVVDVLVTTDAVARTRTADLERVVSAWFRALVALKARPTDVAALVSEREKQTPDAYLASLR